MRKTLILAAVVAAACADVAVSNPLFEGWYADPQIRRFGETYWIFPTYSHDFKEQTFMDVFSSRDLKTWTKHPRALDIKNISWARGALWAPDAHENGGRYYVFFSANDAYPVGGKKIDGDPQIEPEIGGYGGIGVAVADRPEGPYHDLIGKPLIDRFWNAAQPIDQYVFRYKDDWYMVYGGWRRCNMVRLADDFRSLVPFEDGKMWHDMTPKDYVEGSVLFERKGKWYFVYSSGAWTKDDYRVNYSMSDSPFGPFEFKGCVLSSQRPLATGAGHHSVLCLPGTDEWYICYHRRPIPNLSAHHRVTCLDRMCFNEDGTIRSVKMTSGAVELSRCRTGIPLERGEKTRDVGANLNGERWLDDKGVPVNAHGGGVLFHEGRYWWFGEHKGLDKEGHKAKVGVHVYSSDDLASWRDDGIALKVSDDSESDIRAGNTIERPKVIFCPKTGKFSMFFHLEFEGKGYSAARVGIAVADRVQGPYRFLRSLRPLVRCWPYDVPEKRRTPETLAKMTDELDIRTYRASSYSPMPMFGNFFEGGQMVRDQTLFVDDDGKAYHIYASEGNATLQIAELTEDYLDYTGRFARIFPKGFNEAPAICKRNGTYFMITSDCTGWSPNACRSYFAKDILGPWHEIGNPCRGTNPATGLGPEKTWGGQSTFILKVQDEDRYIAMFDEWHPDCLGDSRYYWLPITFTDDGRIEISWKNECGVSK